MQRSRRHQRAAAGADGRPHPSPGQGPGILTFSKESLTRPFLEKAGVDPDTPVVGMPPGSEFQRSIREGDPAVTFETLQRFWHVGPRSLRPEHRMVAHTGFITVCRRIAVD